MSTLVSVAGGGGGSGGSVTEIQSQTPTGSARLTPKCNLQSGDVSPSTPSTPKHHHHHHHAQPTSTPGLAGSAPSTPKCQLALPISSPQCYPAAPPSPTPGALERRQVTSFSSVDSPGSTPSSSSRGPGTGTSSENQSQTSLSSSVYHHQQQLQQLQQQQQQYNATKSGFYRPEPLVLDMSSGSSTPVSRHADPIQLPQISRIIGTDESLSISTTSSRTSSTGPRSPVSATSSATGGRGGSGSAKLISPSGQRVQTLEIHVGPPTPGGGSRTTGFGGEGSVPTTATNSVDGGSARDSWDPQPVDHQTGQLDGMSSSQGEQPVDQYSVSPSSSDWTSTPRSNKDTTTTATTTATTTSSAEMTPTTPQSSSVCGHGGPCGQNGRGAAETSSDQATPRSQTKSVASSATSDSRSRPPPPVESIDALRHHQDSDRTPRSQQPQSPLSSSSRKCHSYRDHQNAETPADNADQSMIVDWDGSVVCGGQPGGRNVVSPLQPYPCGYAGRRSYSPRHANDYKHCVTSEPELVRPSRRQREDTYTKLFGKPDSPRGKKTMSATGSSSRRPEDTQKTLFGPPPDPRPLSVRRGHTDTHHSLFGPPPSTTPRHNRAPFQDSPDLLRHDAGTPTRDSGHVEAVKVRYPLRHENTRSKLFGENNSAAGSSDGNSCGRHGGGNESTASSVSTSPRQVSGRRQSCPLTRIFGPYEPIGSEQQSSRAPPPAEPVAQ